jgi:hypothetical protein
MTFKINLPLLLVIILMTVNLMACASESNYLPSSAESEFGMRDYATAEMKSENSLDSGPMISRESQMAPPMSKESIPAQYEMAPPMSEESIPAQYDLEISSLREQSDTPTAQLVSQDRIIVRTVDMSIEVSDVSESLDQISLLAVEFGGWVVDTSRSEKHRGRTTFRVPASILDEVVTRLRKLATEVKSEISTSQDVTDQYYDSTARLLSLQTERDVLRKLFEEATSVEDALKVRGFLAEIQAGIEVLQAQIQRLEKTSTFSLVTVSIEANPSEMTVDAGQDQTAGVGESIRFRATFIPPKDMNHFLFTWDFGDGSWVATSDRTAPTEDPDTRVTATVTHEYNDERDSPYFAKVSISGTGDSGLAEGEDILVVTVTRVPTIEVFAGDTIIVEESDMAQFLGSFTRPEGVSDVKFTWDFGDGSPPVTGSLDEGMTVAAAEHSYKNFRPLPYKATLTVTSANEAGDSKGVGSINVEVTEYKGWFVSGWSFLDQIKSAVRSLSAIVKIALNVLLWILILSPAWGALTAIGYFGWRFRPFLKKTGSSNDK